MSGGSSPLLAAAAGGTGGVGGRNPSQQQQQQHHGCEPGRGSETSGREESTGKAAAAAAVGRIGGGIGSRGARPSSVAAAAAAALSPMETAVANECLVSLLAMHGTVARLATQPQVRAALRREGFPDVNDALDLLKDVDALRGYGVRDRLWRGRRGAALVRVRAEDSLFGRLPPELFRNVLMFMAS